MTMVATTKKSGRFLPASGKGKNVGRIAGGQTSAVPPGGTGVFGRRPYANPLPPTVVVGGLIDKLQQKNPAATAGLPHPFDGPNYRPTATQPQLPATVATNNVPGQKVFSASVQKITPTDRGTFFTLQTNVPLIRTVGGANKSGPKSNTPFHPNPPKRLAPQVGGAQVETTKVVNSTKPPSFSSYGNIWQDPNNSFIKGQPSAAGGGVGSGRWQTTKRSAV